MRIWYALSALGIISVVAGATYLLILRQDADEKVVDLRGQSEVSVVLRDRGFEPRDLRISQGTKVTFSTDRDHKFWPASNSHPSHTLYPEFDPKHLIEPGDTWSFTFERVGRWGFHDHVRSYFTGTIYVE